MRGPAFALVLLAAAARAAPPALSTAAVARELEESSGRLDEEREGFMLATAGIGGIAKALDASSPDRREAADTKALIVRLLDSRRRETAPLELRTALLAEQLRRYRETGVLSPTPPETEAQLKKLIDAPWEKWSGRRPVASLSLDLAELQEQLRRWRRPAELLLPAANRERPVAAAPPAADGFMRDRGAGRPAADPVPELIAELSSPEPRRRALAADALAGRGSAAGPAVAALDAALLDPDARVRASAALALGAAGTVPPDVVAAVRRALDDRDADVRLSARLALRRLDPGSSAQPPSAK